MRLFSERKTALITGGSQGIGLGIANSLAAEGVDLILVARDPQALERAQADLQAHFGVTVRTITMDMSRPGAAEALAGQAGDFDILINNAGAVPAGNILTLDEASLRDGWELKLFGYISLTRVFYQQFAQRGDGVIINITGLASDRHDFDYLAGSTANAGLAAFSRTVGSRSLNDGVRVLAVNPGAVETARTRKWLKAKAREEFGDESRWQEYFRDLPQGRAATVKEVGDVVAFLASDRAGYVSGTSVTVDGGHELPPEIRTLT